MVDRMLAEYTQNCPVPVRRLGNRFYLFGTIKIYAEIINEEMVIRVGGKYMLFQEFIDIYAEQELKNINSIIERKGLTSIDQLDLVHYCLNQNRASYSNFTNEVSLSNIKIKQLP